MKKTTKPRPLRLLRVEDEADNICPPKMRIEDSGRIGFWDSFVQGLSKGDIYVVKPEKEKEGTVEPISGKPDIVTIDFRFPKDDSTPTWDQSRIHLGSSMQDEAGWSNMLLQKNTGVVIGTTLSGLAEQWDVPTVFSLHTYAVEDTNKDVSTVLMVGQMLALAGKPFPLDEDAFDCASDYFEKLPRDTVEAVMKSIKMFRQKLKDRLGVMEDKHERPIRLFVNPYSLTQLLNIFATPYKKPEELDRRLSKVGLDLIDRDGEIDCLDIRSLFLDCLDDSSAPDRDWGMLPLHCVKGPDNDSDQDEIMEKGIVLEFVEKLYEKLGKSYLDAADIIQVNRLSGDSCSIMDLKHPAARLLGVVFAHAEESSQQRNELNRKLLRPWDPQLDNINEEDRNAPTLLDCLRAIVYVIKHSEMLADSEEISDDPGEMYWPIVGRRQAGILNLVDEFCIGEEIRDSREEYHLCQVLKRIMQYTDYQMAELVGTMSSLNGEEDSEESAQLPWKKNGGQKHRDQQKAIILKLMKYLIDAEMVEEKRTVNDKPTKLSYKLLHSSFTEKICITTPRIERKRILDLMGIKEDTELKRIVERCGYSNWSAFMERLSEGRLPRHLNEAAKWYIENYHSDLSEDD